MTTIFQAATEQEADDVRGLMRDFSAWRRNPQKDGSAFEDDVSRDRDLDEDLTNTLGRYAPPHGRLLIAYEADMLAGCAALRDRGDGACEVERIFVRDVFRGQRIGRALLERLLLEAKAAGYLCMCFDARADEQDAQRLCERAGFRRISPPLMDNLGRPAPICRSRETSDRWRRPNNAALLRDDLRSRASERGSN